MEASKRDPYIVTFDNALAPEICDEIIERFESDPHVYRGVTGRGYAPDIKRSDDLFISNRDEWNDIDEKLYESLSTHLTYYNNYLVKEVGYPKDAVERDFVDLGYQVQRTVPGGFYHWHEDGSPGQRERSWRTLTYLWYLNDVEEGHTEFLTGEKITCEKGKLLLFPAVWTHIHRGTRPKSIKYVCTGWITERHGPINTEDNEMPLEDGPTEGLVDTVSGGDEGSSETPTSGT